MSKFIPKVVNGKLPEVADGSMIFDKATKKIYFDFDNQHQEVKSGEDYTAGTGIEISSENEISVNDTIATKSELDTKQAKLPNAAETGFVLKATDTVGGVEWAEAGSGLPDFSEVSDGKCLKVKVTPKVEKFATALKDGDTTFYIKTVAKLDLNNINYDTTVMGYPAKLLFSFTSDFFGSGAHVSMIIFKSISEIGIVSPTLWLARYREDDKNSSEGEWVPEIPLYSDADFIFPGMGTFEAGWLFDQTSGKFALYALELATLFPVIVGARNIRKISTTTIVNDVVEDFDFTEVFGATAEVIVIAPESHEVVWDNVLPDPTDNNQFYMSNVEQYDFAGFKALEAAGEEVVSEITKISLNLNDIPSSVDRFGFDLGDTILYTMWLSDYPYGPSDSWYDRDTGNGIFIHIEDAAESEKNEVALGLCFHKYDLDGELVDIKNILLYASAPMTFEHTYDKYDSESGEYVEASATYTATSAGWAIEDSEIDLGVAAISPFGGISIDALFVLLGNVLSTQGDLFYPNKRIKPSKFKSYAELLKSSSIVDTYGYGYTDSNSSTEHYVLAVEPIDDYFEDALVTNLTAVNIPIIPELSASEYAEGRLLVTKAKEKEGKWSHYEWLSAPYNDNDVLTYTKSQGIHWSQGGSSEITWGSITGNINNQNDLATKFTNIDSQVGTLEANIATINTTITDVKAQLGTKQAQLTSANAGVGINITKELISPVEINIGYPKLVLDENKIRNGINDQVGTEVGASFYLGTLRDKDNRQFSLIAACYYEERDAHGPGPKLYISGYGKSYIILDAFGLNQEIQAAGNILLPEMINMDGEYPFIDLKFDSISTEGHYQPLDWNGKWLGREGQVKIGAAIEWGTITGDLTAQSDLNTKFTELSTGKQDKLESGSNIKTLNGESILGSGNLELALPEYPTQTVSYSYTYDMCGGEVPAYADFSGLNLASNAVYKVVASNTTRYSSSDPYYSAIFTVYTDSNGILAGIASARGMNTRDATPTIGPETILYCKDKNLQKVKWQYQNTSSSYPTWQDVAPDYNQYMSGTLYMYVTRIL